MGEGPLTGWGFGHCGGASHARRFSSSGFGRGGGWRHRYWATGRPLWSRFGGWRESPWSADDERRALEREAETLETELRHLKARIEELESPDSD
jgi:hypothetical protein